MKTTIIQKLSLVLFFAASVVLQAQTTSRPVRIATASRVALATSSYEPFVSPGIRITNITDRRSERTVNRVWVASIVSLVAATSFDAMSSLGKNEANHLLASGNGSFGDRGIALKAAFTTAVIVPEILICRHKAYKKKFALANFAQTALFSGVAVRNLGIPNSH